SPRDAIILNSSAKVSPRVRAILHDNLVLPMFGAPMLIPCQPSLTLAQCKAGIVGAFPALSARPSSEFDECLSMMGEDLAAVRKPNPGRKVGRIAVNQSVQKSNKRLEADREICIRHKVPVIITSVGARPDVVKAVQEYGGLVFHDVMTMRHVEK